MRKTVRNCRSLNMQTIRVRRDRPGSLAISLALAITMLVVYLLSMQARPETEATAAAAIRSNAEIRMEAMDVQYLLGSIHDDATQANVAAALCAQSGGAGIVLRDENRFAVVYAAGTDFSDADAPVIRRSSSGLTLNVDAPADVVAALRDGISALHALAFETSSMAASIESGASDSRSASSLLGVYKTHLQSAASALSGADSPAAALISAAMENVLVHLVPAAQSALPGQIRLLHAAACNQWISLASNLINLST